MAVVQSLIVKNKPYDTNRLTIVGSQSGDQYYYYSESSGVRHYVNPISSTISAPLESVTFNAYLSFTSSGTASWDFTLIPMSAGETCIIETKAHAMNSDGSKAFVMKSFGSFRHSGTELKVLGNSFDYDIKTDMYGCDVQFYNYATQSVNMEIIGESGEVLDWDVYITYSKGYHTLITGASAGGGSSGGGSPWYPQPPSRNDATA